MIVTVTLNPAIERIVALPELFLGDTNHIVDGSLDAGGGGVKVSRMIHELGGESIATGFVAGVLGRFIEQSLKSLGITSAFTRIPGDPRVDVSILETRQQRQTTIVDPGPRANVDNVRRLRSLLYQTIRPDDWVILSGSVPPGLLCSVYADLTELVHGFGAKVCLDADGQPMVEAVKAMPDLVVVHCEALERLVGRPLAHDQDVNLAAYEVQNGGVRIVVVDMGPRGAFVVSQNGAYWATPPDVPTVQSSNSVDSLVAGFVLALTRGESLDEAIRLGVAAAAATAMQPGTRIGTHADVDRLCRLVTVRPLRAQLAA